MHDAVNCSFCGVSSRDVLVMFANDAAAICPACAALAHKAAEEAKPRGDGLWSEYPGHARRRARAVLENEAR